MNPPSPITPGARFNKWTVIEGRGVNRYQMTMVLARCECGEEREVILANLRAGVSRSCAPCARARRDYTDFVPVGGSGKLTGDYIHEVKRRLSIGHQRGQIARDYGVKWITIDNIWKERAWKNVPWPAGWHPPTRKAE